MQTPEERNLATAKEWIAERAGYYMLEVTARELAVHGQVELPKGLIDLCVERAFNDYRQIVEKFIKEQTGQLTTKDVDYYEQTRPSA